jgi:hypothetical protein
MPKTPKPTASTTDVTQKSTVMACDMLFLWMHFRRPCHVFVRHFTSQNLLLSTTFS